MATRVNGSQHPPTTNPSANPQSPSSPPPPPRPPAQTHSPKSPTAGSATPPPSPFSPTPPSLTAYEKQYYPSQPISLSGIASLAFLLGAALSLSTTLSAVLALRGSHFWRPPFFAAALAVFHFLEFWTTARYNTKAAQVSSFLLNQNGSAYTIAHAAAMAESLISCLLVTYPPSTFLPGFITSWALPALPAWVGTLTLTIGLVLVPLGQLVRSLAMVQAGGNFNHIVQARKASSHQLVTSGIYSLSRHPSYFGFFWWGLGTQLVLGNVVCFVGYTVVLWVFFKRRIAGEEEYLVRFFGQEYHDYRASTRVGIPFIR
ncbi:farnesyl cysteine-carboxyl methyltransferase [Pseudogymnoascus australis]